MASYEQSVVQMAGSSSDSPLLSGVVVIVKHGTIDMLIAAGLLTQ